MRTESIPQPDLTQGHVVNRRTFAYRDAGDGKEPGYDATSGPERYLRYQITPDGVSPMAIPGHAGRRLRRHRPGAHAGRQYQLGCAQPLGDDREALPQSWTASVQKAPPAHEYGDPSAEIGFLTWGSTLGVVAEAIDRLAARGIKAHALAPRMVWPLPTHQIDPFLKNKRQVFVPEVNYTGQFAQLLKTHYQNVEFTRLNVYGGQPFSVTRIIESVDQKPSSNGTVETRTEAAVHA